MSMRAIIVAALALAVACAPSASTSGPADPAGDGGESPPLLFALTADDARLDASELTLRGTSHLVWFTDRPARDSGVMPASVLVDQWSAMGLDEIPPNASLAWHGANGTDALHVLELGPPSIGKDAGTMTFPVTELSGSPAKARGELGSVTLFIDDVTTGAISLEVRDTQGSPLPGVTVEATGPQSMTQITSASGQVQFVLLPPGTYSVTAELEGFSPTTRKGIILQAGRNADLELTMAPSVLED